MWSCRGFLISGHSQRSLWSDLGAGTHEDAMILKTSSSSSLLVSWKPLLSGELCLCSWKTRQDYFNTPPPQIQKYAGDRFLGFWITLCSQREPVEAIHFLWNWKLTWSLLQMSSFRFSNDWQPLKIRQNTKLWWPVLLERAIKIVYPVKASASVFPGLKTWWN